MAAKSDPGSMAALEPLIGEWSIIPNFKGMPQPETGAPVSFEWMTGEQFIIERWEVPDVPEAPDGLAIIGADPEKKGGFLQHYFDSRGVARVYKMTIERGVWKLWRDTPDFSPLDFAQRFTGKFSEDGKTITGAWEICHDGKNWEHDFDLTYRKV